MFRGLVRGLVENGRISTTEAKAKALQQEIDKVFQLMRKDTLAARRDMLARLGNDSTTVDTLYSRYLKLAKDRSSGFTTLTWKGERRGDNTRMALVEFIQLKEEAPEKPAKAKETKS